MTLTVLANTMNATEHDARSKPDPSQDSIDHINLHYNFAKTPVGRRLSTFYAARFNHPSLGPFKCIESLRLYVKTGCQDDTFRSLNGTEAINHYREAMDRGNLKNNNVPNMGAVMMDAYYAMLNAHPVIASLFTESTLPFDFYYLVPGTQHPIRPKDSAELTQTLTTLRDLMRQGQAPTPMSNEEYAKLIARNPSR